MPKISKVFANLSVVIIALISMLWIFSSKVYATTIPNGGSSIETAVDITEGTYTVGSLEAEEEQFYVININAGQELVVTATFQVSQEYEDYGTNNAIDILDEDGVALVEEYESAGTPMSASILANSTNASYTYYIRIADDTWGTESGTLTVVVNDRFDAGSSTDAGSTFDSPMPISAGSYTGYLSEVDTDDRYTMTANSGTLSVKVTPEEDAMPTITIYDANRAEVASEWATNGGAIVTATVELLSSQKVYINVNCDINTGCSSSASAYTLVITNGTGTVTEDPDTGEDIVTGEPFITYDIITPVEPTGTAVELDAEVSTPLTDTFGENVKIREIVNEKIIYVVEEEVKTTDLASIKVAMEALGYTTKSFTDDTLVVEKGLKQITFQIFEGSNQIIVSQRTITNTLALWVGIGIGVVVLVILVILLVKKMKKESASGEGEKKEEKKEEVEKPSEPVKEEEPEKVEEVTKEEKPKEGDDTVKIDVPEGSTLIIEKNKEDKK